MVQGALAAALLLLPAAAGAATWVGWTKQEIICPGAGSWIDFDDFTLVMEPGSGTGVLTLAGFPGVDVATDWTIDGNWAHFAVSTQLPDGGTFMLYGTTHGHKMKGYMAVHEYTTGCIAIGKLKAWD